MRWRLGLAVLVLVLGAGCIGPADETGQAGQAENVTEQTTPRTDGADTAEESPGGEGATDPSDEGPSAETGQEEAGENRTREDVYLAEGQVGDPAAIRAFDWTIPDGAVRAHPQFPDIEYVPLEAVVETGEAVDLDRLGVFFFRLDETAVRTGSLVEVPRTVVERTATDEETHEEEADRETFTYGLYDREDGDRVGIALAAASSEPGSVDLAFRVPGDGEDATDPASIDELVERAGSQQIHELEATGTGQGLHAATFHESHVRDEEGVQSFTSWSEDVEVARDPPAAVRPLSSSGSVELDSSFETDEGYSRAHVARLGTSSAGQWSAQTSLHGSEDGAGGPFAAAHTYDLPASVPYGTFGFSLWAEASGSGAAELHATVDEVEADRFRFLSFTHVALGASTETLFGLPLEERHTASSLEDRLPLAIPDGAGPGFSLAGETPGRS